MVIYIDAHKNKQQLGLVISRDGYIIEHAFGNFAIIVRQNCGGNSHMETVKSANKEKDLFTETWDTYSKKYNILTDKMESLGMQTNLLDEIISLKSQLTKIALLIKIEDAFKI